MDPMVEQLCTTVDPAAMMRHLDVFARRVKLSGTAEELASFDYLREQLEGYGLRTELILHDAYISLPGTARLALGNEAPDCITHSFSRPSAPGGISGAVVYGGSGTPADFAGIDAAGKIVLLEGIATRLPACTPRRPARSGRSISVRKNISTRCASHRCGTALRRRNWSCCRRRSCSASARRTATP